MRLENRNGEGECYQVSQGVAAVYSDEKQQLTSLKLNGQDIDDHRLYTICLQGYHLHNSASYLNLPESELLADGPSKVVSTSAQQVLEEYLRNHQNINSQLENRLVYLS
jgi:5'-nucleotidase